MGVDARWLLGALVFAAGLLVVAWVVVRRRRVARARAAPRLDVRGKHDHLSRQQRIALYGHKFVTIRGDVVQSGPERRIADFLHKRGVRYVYEAQLHGATPDFYLPDHHIIIEHWGMEHRKYVERRWQKARMYKAKGYKLVETEKRDVPRLEQVLADRLLRADPTVFERGSGRER